MKRIFIILLSILPLVSSAQLTLEDCQRMAREHYPEVAIYGLLEQSAEYNIDVAKRSWLPQITLSGQASWQSAVASFPEKLTQMLEAQGVEVPGIAADQYKVALDVQQVIWDGGISKANKELARAKAKESMLATNVKLYELDERVNSLFFGILLLDGNYAIAQSRDTLLAATRKKLEALQRSGSALQSDIDLVRVEQLTLKQQMEQNRASRNSFAEMLAMFIGREIDSLAMPNDGNWDITGVQRPEVDLLQARMSTLDAQLKSLNSQLMPRLVFFGQGFYGNPGLDMFKSMTSRDWTWNAYLGLRLQWNVSAFFTQKSDRQHLHTQKEMLQSQLGTFWFNNDLQSRRIGGEINRMKRALQNDDEIVALRESIRRTAEVQRENGVIDTPTLLQRIAEEAASRSTRSIHLIEMWKSIYEMKHNINQ